MYNITQCLKTYTLDFSINSRILPVFAVLLLLLLLVCIRMLTSFLSMNHQNIQRSMLHILRMVVNMTNLDKMSFRNIITDMFLSVFLMSTLTYLMNQILKGIMMEHLLTSHYLLSLMILSISENLCLKKRNYSIYLLIYYLLEDGKVVTIQLFTHVKMIVLILMVIISYQ